MAKRKNQTVLIVVLIVAFVLLFNQLGLLTVFDFGDGTFIYPLVGVSGMGNLFSELHTFDVNFNGYDVLVKSSFDIGDTIIVGVSCDNPDADCDIHTVNQVLNGGNLLRISLSSIASCSSQDGFCSGPHFPTVTGARTLNLNISPENLESLSLEFQSTASISVNADECSSDYKGGTVGIYLIRDGSDIIDEKLFGWHSTFVNFPFAPSHSLGGEISLTKLENGNFLLNTFSLDTGIMIPVQREISLPFERYELMIFARNPGISCTAGSSVFQSIVIDDLQVFPPTVFDEGEMDGGDDQQDDEPMDDDEPSDDGQGIGDFDIFDTETIFLLVALIAMVVLLFLFVVRRKRRR